MTYAEKLKDPRWQKKRLKVLERDDWTCQGCYSVEKTLHVHHLCYISGNDPWDYPLADFMTLCADCHEEETNTRGEYEKTLLFALKNQGVLAADILELASAFHLIKGFNPFTIDAIIELIRSKPSVGAVEKSIVVRLNNLEKLGERTKGKIKKWEGENES